MTPKQRLRNHIEDFHRQPHGAISRLTLKDLQRHHREQHHRFYTDHYHAGENLGPGARPPGWSTGDDAIAKT